MKILYLELCNIWVCWNTYLPIFPNFNKHLQNTYDMPGTVYWAANKSENSDSLEPWAETTDIN